MKLTGLVVVSIALLFGESKVYGTMDFCPEGSQMFLLNPNPDGTCPDGLPTVKTPEEEDENKCKEDMNASGTYCGICMEFGATGARKVEPNAKYSEKCDYSCMDNGNPRCIFHTTERGLETINDRKFKIGKICICCCKYCCNNK